MALSSTTTYNVTAQRVIDLALIDIGVAGQGGSQGAAVDPNLRAQALDVLNLVLKELDTLGMLTFNVQRRVQTLTAGVASYVLSNDVSDVDDPARYTISGSTVGNQVTVMSRDEYMYQPDRTIQGPVYRFFPENSFDANGIQQITLNLFPVPSNTGDTLEYAAAIRMQDVTTLSQTIGLPQKWFNAVVQALAARLGPSYSLGVDRLSYLNKRASDAIDAAFEDSGERGNVQLVPFGVASAYGQRGLYR
jgi:hypothetical protein